MSTRFGAALLLAASLLSRPAISAAQSSPSIRSLAAGPIAMSVSRSGIYRVTDAYLASHGVSLTGIHGSDLALLVDGTPVPRYVSTNGPFSASSYIEFYGQSIATRYTSTNVYELAVDPQHALAATNISAAPGGSLPAASYVARYVQGRRTIYDPMAPKEQWFFTQLTTTGTKVTDTDTIYLSSPAVSGSATLTVFARGETDLAGTGPQHHLLVDVNGHGVIDLQFTGIVDKVVRATFPASWLRTGANRVQFVLPGDVKNQYNVDIIDIATFWIDFPRHFVAVHGTFTGRLPALSRVTVSGLAGPVSAWRVVNGAPSRLTGLAIPHSSTRVSFAATAAGTYLLAGERALLRPDSIRPLGDTSYLTKWHAHFLIITVPQFRGALTPLVQYHRSHGLSVKVAYVGDIYDRYNGGVVDASAIKTYIAQAQQQLGTRYVLLVGADTYDYHNYLGCPQSHACGSTHTDPTTHKSVFVPSWNPDNVSLVPSLYARDDYYGEIPSDELYVDTPTGPSLAIGRIPAVSVNDVKTAVSKTLAYFQSSKLGKEAVFASGSEDSTFQQGSDVLAGLLPAQYHVTHADEGTSGATTARHALLDAINANAALVNFVGHGNLEQWGQPPALLTKSLAERLHNDKPALFLGWGCQTAYHIDPTDRSLNATLLFSHGGATLTLGSTGLDLADVQITLASQFYRELFADTAVSTVGDALRVAEGAALHQDAGTRQPVESYELFGDPTLPLAPLRG